MKRIAIITAVGSLAAGTPAVAQSYLYGAPPGGVGTYTPAPYANTDDPRFRDNNWRNSSPENWRENNWREDRSGWRRNNWREDRAGDWRPYNLRNGQEQQDPAKKKKNESAEDDSNDCGMARNQSAALSKGPCRREAPDRQK